MWLGHLCNGRLNENSIQKRGIFQQAMFDYLSGYPGSKGQGPESIWKIVYVVGGLANHLPTNQWRIIIPNWGDVSQKNLKIWQQKPKKLLGNHHFGSIEIPKTYLPTWHFSYQKSSPKALRSRLLSSPLQNWTTYLRWVSIFRAMEVLFAKIIERNLEMIIIYDHIWRPH